MKKKNVIFYQTFLKKHTRADDSNCGSIIVAPFEIL